MYKYAFSTINWCIYPNITNVFLNLGHPPHIIYHIQYKTLIFTPPLPHESQCVWPTVSVT